MGFNVSHLCSYELWIIKKGPTFRLIEKLLKKECLFFFNLRKYKIMIMFVLLMIITYKIFPCKITKFFPVTS